MSFLTRFGRLCFGFAIAFSIISTVITIALASSGVAPPEALTAFPLTSSVLQGIINTANSWAGAGILGTVVAGGLLGGVFLWTIVGSFLFGIAKAFTVLGQSLPPPLSILAPFAGGVIQAFAVIYVVMRLFGKEA